MHLAYSVALSSSSINQSTIASQHTYCSASCAWHILARTLGASLAQEKTHQHKANNLDVSFMHSSNQSFTSLSNIALIPTAVGDVQRRARSGNDHRFSKDAMKSLVDSRPFITKRPMTAITTLIMAGAEEKCATSCPRRVSSQLGMAAYRLQTYLTYCKLQ